MALTLYDLGAGVAGVVVRLNGQGALRQRLLDMGLTRGASFTVIRPAPLGDPLEIEVKGYKLAIRLAEAKLIEVEKPGLAPGRHRHRWGRGNK